MRLLRRALLLLLLVLAGLAHADASVVTRAMRASTVCEIFIEPGEIRAELEIGISDIDSPGASGDGVVIGMFDIDPPRAHGSMPLTSRTGSERSSALD